MFRRFLQNNILLVSVMGAALLLVFFLLGASATKRMEMKDLQRQMAELRDKISRLHRGPVHSVRGNLVRLNRDRQFYEECCLQAEKFYGRPLQNALDKMARAVAVINDSTKQADFSDGDSMREHFMAFYNAEKGRNTRGQIYDTFRRIHGKHWDEAMRAFVQEIDPLTQEPINNTNKDEVLLSLLGLPRDCNGNPAQANAVIEKVHQRLDEMFAKNKIGVGKDALDYGVPQIAAADRKKIISALKVLDFSSDFAARIAKSGISSLDSMQLAQDAPEPRDGLLYYDCSLRVTGSLDSIRELVNLLNAAFPERRVYVVQSLELSRVSHDAADFLNRGLEQSRADGETKKKKSEGHAELSGGEEEKKEPLVPDESSLPYNERKDYAVPVLGSDNLCRADMNVIYVVHAQSELSDGEKQ